MKASDLRQRTKSELQKSLQETREKLRVLRFNLAAGKLKNVREVRELKKDIAKILTILNAQKFVKKDKKDGVIEQKQPEAKTQ